MVSKILVPTDGSKTARKAVRYAVDLAKQLNASVIVLSVVDNRSFIAQTVPAVDTPTHIIAPIEDYLREAAKKHAGEIEKLCDESGVQSETVITIGHPVEDIVKEAKMLKVISLLWVPMVEVLSQPQYLAALPMGSFIARQRFLCSSYGEADKSGSRLQASFREKAGTHPDDFLITSQENRHADAIDSIYGRCLSP